jgi:outer membrane protein
MNYSAGKNSQIFLQKLFVTIFWFVSFSACADTLSLKDYIGISLKHNPQQKTASMGIAASNAAYASSRASFLPHFNGNAMVSRSGTIAIDAQNAAIDVNSVSAGINGNILLFDFGQTRFKYLASGKSLNAAILDSQEVAASTVVNARSAYFNYLLAMQVVVVNEEALKQAHAHLDQAQALFDAGKQAHIAVIKARVDVANAEVNFIHAKNALQLAKVQLDVVAGTLLPEPLLLTDSLSCGEDSISLQDALERAIRERPEIRSLRENVEAAWLLVKAVQAAYLPSINASGGLSWNNNLIGRTVSVGKPSWNVGAAASIPIFTGGDLQASVKKAEASLGKAEAQLDELTQAVNQKVRQYFIQEKEAVQRISATKTLIEQADESLRMSQERFRAGVATSIEIIDAEVTLTNAKISNAQAQSDYHVAHANLLSAIGDQDLQD